MPLKRHAKHVKRSTTATAKPRLGKQGKRTKRQILKGAPAPEVVTADIFWPDRLDHVKAIAMKGLTDAEMASMLGISDSLMASWKAYYPTFAKAIDDGRTVADAKVVAALYNNAVGYEHESDEVVRTRRGAEVVTVKRYYPGETTAQKYWLNNRQPMNWGDKVQVGGDRSPGAKPIGVKNETKEDIINSLLNLVTPRPDGG